MKIENARKYVERLKFLADRGNVQACSTYGTFLMFGAYDAYQMELDFASGKLLPAPVNPRQDPYLIMQRDQYRAIEYIRKAACFDAVSCHEVLVASGIMAYCRRKNPAVGYSPSRFCNDFIVTLYYDKLVKTASPAELAADPLMPVPFVRPAPQHPVNRLFNNYILDLQKYTLYKTYLLAILAIIAITLMLTHRNVEGARLEVLLPIFIVAIDELPFVWESVLTRGTTGPHCSCPEMKQAYELRMSRLPAECKKGPGHYETASIITRNFHHIFQFLNLLLLIIPFALITFKFIKIDFIEKFFDTSSLVYRASILISLTFPLAMLSIDNTFTFKDRICLNQLMLEKELCAKRGV